MRLSRVLTVAAIVALVAGPIKGEDVSGLIHEGSKAPAFEAKDTAGNLIKSSDLIGKTPFETLHPKDVARARGAFDALLKGQSPPSDSEPLSSTSRLTSMTSRRAP